MFYARSERAQISNFLQQQWRPQHQFFAPPYLPIKILHHSGLKKSHFSTIVFTDDNTTTYQPMLFIFYEFHCYYDIYSTAVQIVEEIKKKNLKNREISFFRFSLKKKTPLDFFFQFSYAT